MNDQLKKKNLITVWGYLLFTYYTEEPLNRVKLISYRFGIVLWYGGGGDCRGDSENDIVIYDRNETTFWEKITPKVATIIIIIMRY